MDEVEDVSVSKNDIKKFQEAIKMNSPLAEAKEFSSTMIPSGEPSRRYPVIRSKLRERGLYIVEVGEVQAPDELTTSADFL